MVSMFGRYLKRLAGIWSGLSLAWQFVIAGGIGLLAVMLVVGLWVTSQIRDGVLHNSAATTALYVDSVIAPLLPDMRKSQELDDKKVHFSITPLARTVTSGLSTIRVRSSSRFVVTSEMIPRWLSGKLSAPFQSAQLNLLTLYGQLLAQYLVPIQRL